MKPPVRRSEAPPVGWGGSSTWPALLFVCGAFLTLLAGTYEVAGLEVRLLGIASILVAAAMMAPLAPVDAPRSVNSQIFGWAFTFWAVWMAFSAMWAPIDARTEDNILDLTYLLLAINSSWFIMRRVSADTLDRLWWMVYAAATVLALFAIAAGSVTAGGRLIILDGGPNAFVRVVGLGCVATAALILGRARRSLLVAGLPLLTMAAVLTGSRGGVLGIAISTVVIVILATRHKAKKTRAQLVLALTATFILLALWVWPRVENYVQHRFIFQTLGQRHTAGRSEITADAMDLWASRPLVGVGLDGYWALTGKQYAHPHNLFLSSATEGGTIGLALAALALWTGFRAAWLRQRYKENLPAVAALLVLVSAMFSGSWYDSRLIWFFLAVGIERCARTSLSDVSRHPPVESRPPVIYTLKTPKRSKGALHGSW